MYKLDLTNIKIAVFDFDDTLAKHKNENYLKTRQSNKDNYYLQAYMHPDIFYKEIEPCIAPANLKLLINYCKELGVKVFCISGMRYSLHKQAKEVFLHENYNKDIEFIQVSSQLLKIDAIRVLLKANSLNWNNILFVDDMEENVEMVRELGGNALLPNEANEAIIKSINNNTKTMIIYNSFITKRV